MVIVTGINIYISCVFSAEGSDIARLVAENFIIVDLVTLVW